MKKIATVLAPIDAPWPAMRVSTQLAKSHSASIHLLFLTLPGQDIDYDYPYPNDLSTAEELGSDSALANSNGRLINDKLDLFREECMTASIDLSFEIISSLETLQKESAGTDLLIADAGAAFLEDILPHCPCPVYVAADDHLPEKAILMYNDSENSRYAIEKYAQLFPEFKSLPTSLLSINPESEAVNQEYLGRFMKAGFTNISSATRTGRLKKELHQFISDLPDQLLVVLGAFGRNELSRFFHESVANILLKEKSVSLFIAHA